MTLRFGALPAVMVATVAARPAAAQDVHDFSAWIAMMATPHGSMPPMVTRRMAGHSSSR